MKDTNWRSVPLPRRMRALQRDSRGYPVPFIILRNDKGVPLFAINDSQRAVRCIVERRCPICGNRMAGPVWFVGGPLSAFHEQGAYIDSAMHYECMEYALRVCPYLAMPHYTGSVANAQALKAPVNVTLVEQTMIPGRTAISVAIQVDKYTCQIRHGGDYRIRPERPYLRIEYWLNGLKLSDAEGSAIAQKFLATEAPARVAKALERR